MKSLTRKAGARPLPLLPGLALSAGLISLDLRLVDPRCDDAFSGECSVCDSDIGFSSFKSFVAS